MSEKKSKSIWFLITIAALSGWFYFTVGMTKSPEALQTATLQNERPIEEQQLRNRIDSVLAKLKPGIRVDAIEPSPIAGMVTVRIAGGASLQVTKDGSHLMTGDLFEVREAALVNLSESERVATRSKLLATIPKDKTINFTPSVTKGTAFVFTDVDCFYCQKLHQGIAEMNKLGIEVRYLAYPRAGLGSISYQKIASAWCASNPKAAITRLKNKEQIPTNVCPNNPVAEEFELGGRMGVRGTPAIYLANGVNIAGYVTPQELARRMNIAVN